MLTKNEATSAPWARRNALGVLKVPVEQRPYFRENVNPAAMNPGDKKHPTAWSYSIRQVRLQNGKVYDYFSNGNLYETRFGPTTNNTNTDAQLKHPASTRDYCYNSALDRLNEKVRGKLDLSVSFAELGSTKRMLAVTEGLNDFIANVGRNKLGIVRRASRALSNRYLEWRYGWQPLLSDIYDAANESVNYIVNEISHVKGTATIQYPESSVQKLIIETGGLIDIPCKQTGKCSVAVNLSFKTGGHDLDRWTSLNPVSIAWEILPYSFVVDWMYDVGGFLRAMETSLLYKNSFVGGFVSEVDVSELSYVYSGRRDVPGGYLTYDRLDGYSKRLDFQRTILSSYPLPRLPTWNAKLGSAQLLTSAALLRQLIVDSPQKDPSTPRRKSALQGQGKSFWEARASKLLLGNGLVR